MATYDVSDFQTEVIDRSSQLPVVVDFWAAWCGPCKALGPILEKLAGEAAGRWELAKLDTEAHPQVAADFAIRSIPAVKLFIDGAMVSEFVGALPEETIRQWLDEVLPGPGADQLREARELLAAGGAAGAERARELLEEVLAADGFHEEARVLLAEALVFDEPTAMLPLLEELSSGSKLGDRVEALRTIARLLLLLPAGDGLDDRPAKDAYVEAIGALARRDFDSALEGFLEVVGGDRSLDDDGARNACLAIFTLLGDETAGTREYRKRLAQALFA
jgi:putative thioredoxin